MDVICNDYLCALVVYLIFVLHGSQLDSKHKEVCWTVVNFPRVILYTSHFHGDQHTDLSDVNVCHKVIPRFIFYTLKIQVNTSEVQTSNLVSAYNVAINGFWKDKCCRSAMRISCPQYLLIKCIWLPLWSSNQSSRGPGFDFRRYQIFWEVVGLERGPLILVRITEELLRWKSSNSGLECRD
jgi:hypothetical protein